MEVSKETLKAIAQEFHGIEISDDELDIVLPEVRGYVSAMRSLDDLDLSDVMSARLLKVKEGDES
ncbi:hypothetical protein FIM12_03660 [SAR202 cluster bacterium AD-804-J14_MRT_500m]|nr:hypothetical protein [SAR202 cluster bacterium AD-804-J14_MRT_500m]|tara:strand:+ start:14 stop:208 length:195 start_codon:yes stop_codon:yes gene_type:complete